MTFQEIMSLAFGIALGISLGFVVIIMFICVVMFIRSVNEERQRRQDEAYRRQKWEKGATRPPTSEEAQDQYRRDFG